MPIYEYHCSENNKIYSFFAKSVSSGERVPRCPDNPEYSMVRLISGFSVTGTARKGETEGKEGGDGLDDPRLESAMAQMEQEMAGMDEENPDPRQLGSLMRKMSEMTGEKMPASMDEMMGRLEAGEDPEKLEEEYGDLLDDEEGLMGEEGTDPSDGDGGSSEITSSGRIRVPRRPAPERDPQLYDMAEYLPEADSD
jgi:hypothetical protein